MKKFISGLIVGLIICSSLIVFADTIIGKQVQGLFPLIINGQRCDKDAIVIDGTSYLPVRKAGEMFGYEVDFKDNEVILSNQPESIEEDIQVLKYIIKSDKYNSPSYYDHRYEKWITETDYFLKFDNELYLYLDIILDITGGWYISNNEVPGEYKIVLPNKTTLIFNRYKMLLAQGRNITNGEDTNGITQGGGWYIKLSALGLTTRIEGDTIIVE